MSYICKDLVKEIKDIFIDLMYEHNDFEFATKKILSDYAYDLDDYDDGTAIWLGLALVQWECGVLQTEIKVRAEQNAQNKIEQCIAANNLKDVIYLKKAISKICLPQKPPKKFGKRQQYICPWEIGDVYAYKFTDIYSHKMAYSYFVKVDNKLWWPKHIIPVICFFNIVTTELLDLSSVIKNTYMIQVSPPQAYINHPKVLKSYRIGIITEKEKDVPIDKLIYLGKFKEAIPMIIDNPNISTFYWKNMEYYLSKLINWWDIKIQ